MLKFRAFLFAVALASPLRWLRPRRRPRRLAVRAASARGSSRPARPAAPATRPSGGQAVLRGHVPDRTAGQAAARRVGSRRLPGRPVLREAGGVVRSSTPRPTCITSRCEPRQRAVRRTAGCRMTRRSSRSSSADFKRLWATNFLDDLVGGDLRLQVLQRRHRQDDRLQHGGAAARQDRRLRRIEEGRAVEDRRGAEEAEPADRARLVHRPGPHPQGRRGRPRACTRRRATSTPR